MATKKPASKVQKAPAQNVKDIVLIMHLLTFAGSVIPMGNIIGPLILWLYKKDTSPLIDQAGKDVLNFNISYTIYLVACMLLVFVFIGIPLAFIVAIVMLYATIKGSIYASQGKVYTYPYVITFIGGKNALMM